MKKNGLKKSAYNYKIIDNEGNYLLYNFIKGINSFCKIRKYDIDAYNELMNCDIIYKNLDNPTINQLFQFGVLINAHENEYEKIKAMYLDAIMDNKLLLIIMPTEQCNFRCRYCYEKFEKDSMSKDTQNAIIKFIQRNKHKYSGVSIDWFGGEPLLEIDIIEYILSNLKKIKCVYLSSITTNAYNLTPDVFEKLYNLRVYNYQITLDGLKEQHDNQRYLSNKLGTFDKIINNLQFIRDNTRFSKANILIRTNVTSQILQNLNEFIEYYKINFSQDSRFNIGITPAWSVDNNYSTSNEIFDEFINTNELTKKLEEVGYYSESSLKIGNMHQVISPVGPLCYAAKKNSFVVGSDATLYKCTVNFEMHENKIGCLKSNGFLEILDYEYHSWYNPIDWRKMCKKCFYLPVCCGGPCPASNKFNNKTDNGNKCFSVEIKKNIDNFMIYYSSKYNFPFISFV